MIVDMTRPGIVFRSKRYSAEYQMQVLREAGAGRIVSPRASWRSLFRGAPAIRAGDVVYVFALALVPTERGGDELPPTAQAAAFMYECKARGAVVVEAVTGRRSDNRRDFSAMIADAVKALREGASRRAPAGYAKRGRKRLPVPPHDVPRLRVIWRSAEYESAGKALAALASEGYEMSEATARRLLGKRHR